MKNRNRIVVKQGLVGSSDFTRVKAHRAALVENHEKNILFFNSLKEKEVKIEITEEYLLSMYSLVMVLGSWSPLRNYIGQLIFMYENGFKFK